MLKNYVRIDKNEDNTYTCFIEINGTVYGTGIRFTDFKDAKEYAKTIIDKYGKED